MIQFGSMAVFLIVVIAISLAFDLGDVGTAQVSQGFNSAFIAVAFTLGWRKMPHCPPLRELPEGQSVFTAGFIQMYRTAKTIHSKYGSGLRWFFWGVVFAEAGASAFTTLAVIFLDEQLGLSGTEIGITFLVVLIFVLPGAHLGSLVTRRYDPNISWRLSMVGLILASAGGTALVDVLPNFTAYFYGAVLGVLLGWFYPTENLFFSLCTPKGQETEMAGFFVYCTQILSWLPPLVFTALTEADVRQTYGIMSLSVYFAIAIGLLSCAAPWDAIMKESGRENDRKDLRKITEALH